MESLTASLESLTVEETPWDHILKELKYTGEEECIITADFIKKCKASWKGSECQFEPRLLAYQSSATDRPAIFKKHSLSMLPIENGTYLLTKQIIYKPLAYDGGDALTIKLDSTSDILQLGNSETSLIDNLRYSKLFDTLLEEPITHGPLLNGRHRCTFSMKLGTKSIDVKGVQYEVDACYESEHKILLVEGKSATKQIDSFNTRQLYYPFRMIRSVSKKEIVPVFLHKLKDVVHLWIYAFTEEDCMDSLVLKKHLVVTIEMI
jgi:hypothetical protein